MPTEKPTTNQRSFLNRARGKFWNWIRNLGHQNDGLSDTNNVEVRLDDECAKVFGMDNDGLQRFDVESLHDDLSNSNEPKNYGEKEFNLHRTESYPHPHASLKPSRSSLKRQTTTSSHINTNLTPVDAPMTIPKSPSSTTKILSPSSDTPPSIGSPIFHITDSDQTVHYAPFNFNDDDDLTAISSESECILSDPGGYRSPPEYTPDRKVQFVNGEKTAEEMSPVKERRRRGSRHSKSRKYSLQDSSTKSNAHPKNRRVSTQPEDLRLKGADRDQLDSHRSDDPKALRRHRTSRPSIVHIGRKDGMDNFQAALMKKMYDHSPHAIFVQLDELFGGNEDREWKETARWIKYEEDVEEGVDRWGKPHVASLSFHSLLNLRKCLEEGLVNLDMEEKELPGIAYRVCEDLYKEDLIREEDKAPLMRILLLRHRHVNEHHDRGFRFSRKQSYTSLQNLSDAEKRKASYQIDVPFGSKKIGRNVESEGHLLPNNHTSIDMKEEMYTISSEDMKKAQNDPILKRIPSDAQSTSVLVGDVDFLEQPAIAFIRLAEAVYIPSLIEVNIPVRFIFILLGPKGANLDYHEVGRSISTLMANHEFHNIAYEAYNRKALLSAINEFLDDSIVLPPGDWERQALLPIEEIKAKSERIRKRKEDALKKAVGEVAKPMLVSDDGGKKPPFPNPLERTRRPFGGLINDLKRRYPFYLSDLKSGLNPQCAAAALFMYFAALSGAITFGGLMSDKTQNLIGVSETLVATSVAGLIFALLGGQPLVIVGTTGPLLLFDESLYQFCKSSGIDYLTIRFYIGIWLGVIALLVASVEGSVFVKWFSRFTEEIFSALISLLYIVESVMNLVLVFTRHPLRGTYYNLNNLMQELNETVYNSTTDNLFARNVSELTAIIKNSSVPPSVPLYDSIGPLNQPNTALLCTILSLGTFAIAYYLLLFRNSQFLGRNARRALGDFGVPIAIVIMASLNYFVPNTHTQRLTVPKGFTPSNPEVRGWLVDPKGTLQPIELWVAFAAGVPALLVYILLFMETHITELIIDKPERKLKKGSGFHLDIVLICLLNVGCGFIGAPWVCVATVRSVAHVQAVTVMSRTHAPGEKPHIIEVKEQRVSAFVVSLLIGVSVLMSPLLRLVPMSVLFGVFLYMGVASTNGIQFFDRIRLFFMPPKHHPAASYVRKVGSFFFTFLNVVYSTRFI
ncbi:band 3 anion transport protein-like isoform X4 [Photinus pyralis]|uniref:band 3 anion transport protein-like isoform X4 n=1 Tax=Photinus pyralis TaxID=7054 RepID=UPI0012671F15|nr:band 3 anion transport protein-like isoform X4 [Photinus pyralis]